MAQGLNYEISKTMGFLARTVSLSLITPLSTLDARLAVTLHPHSNKQRAYSPPPPMTHMISICVILFCLMFICLLLFRLKTCHLCDSTYGICVRSSIGGLSSHILFARSTLRHPPLCLLVHTYRATIMMVRSRLPCAPCIYIFYCD